MRRGGSGSTMAAGASLPLRLRAVSAQRLEQHRSVPPGAGTSIAPLAATVAPHAAQRAAVMLAS